MDKRPTRLRLADRSIRVTYHGGTIYTDDSQTVMRSEDNETGHFGLCFTVGGYRLAVSELSPDVPETLLHEAMHAALRIHGGSRLLEEETEECVVQQLAAAVCELLRRNRGLAAFLERGP